MPQNKKHHYVPRFYLKRFSPDGRSIGLYNIDRQLRIGSAQLKGQCYRDYFYGTNNEVEKALSQVEGAASHILRDIDQAGELPPNPSIPYINLLFFIVVQAHRTAYEAEALNEMNDDLMKVVLREKAQNEGIDLDNFQIGIRDVGLHAVGIATELYPMALDLGAKLLINNTEEELVLSDNPVVKYNQLMSFETGGSNTGIVAKGLQIFVPLDPQKVAVFYDREVYRLGSENESVVAVDNPQDIYELNALQFCSAHKNIYYRDAAYDPAPLDRKARRFLRATKTETRVYSSEETSTGTSELVGTSRQDVDTNLKLSFLTLRKSAKQWRQEFRKLKERPVSVVRNQQMIDDHEEFQELVEKEEYKGYQYLEFLGKKYGDDQSGVEQ